MTRATVCVLVLSWLLAGLEAAPAEPDVRQVYVLSYDGASILAAWRKPAGESPFPAILYMPIGGPR